MKINKIKSLNREIQETLRTTPNTLLTGTKASTRPIPSTQMPQLSCQFCEDIKRQNYRLKQEVYELQEKNEREGELERELAALRELYELKCREVELTNGQFQKCKQKMKNLKEKNEEFVQNSLKALQKVL